MASRCNWHRHLTNGLALFVLACLVPVSALAESQVFYFAERKFEIPFEMPDGRSFNQIILHASEGDNRPYTRIGSTAKARGAFEFTASGDGWYFFVIQVEEKNGSFSPPRPNLAMPDMRVCVDSQKPTIVLQPIAANGRDGSVAVQWSIKDPNLDLASLRLEYRTQGTQQWMPLKFRQLAFARFDWYPTGTGPFEVRLQVKDKAENAAEATTVVRGDPSRSPGPNPGAGAGAGAGAVGGGAAPPPGNKPVIHVNKKVFKLTYKIDRGGPSGVKYVEVWMTRDTTQWSKFGGHAPPEGPHEITVPQTGRYGFTLRPISGVGRGPNPPGVGDMPQVWVEVDETPPTVQLHNIVVGEGADNGTVTVNWRADDRFLGDKPITIYYSQTVDGEWKLLQGPLENTGSAKCPTQGLPFEFFVRVEAVDRAGNKAQDQTKQSIKVDLSVPQVSDVNVTIGEQANKPPP